MKTKLQAQVRQVENGYLVTLYGPAMSPFRESIPVGEERLYVADDETSLGKLLTRLANEANGVDTTTMGGRS